MGKGLIHSNKSTLRLNTSFFQDDLSLNLLISPLIISEPIQPCSRLMRLQAETLSKKFCQNSLEEIKETEIDLPVILKTKFCLIVIYYNTLLNF